MAKATAHPTKEQETTDVPQLQDRIGELERCIVDLDSASNDALARIRSIAKLALHYMEDPKAYMSSMEMVSDALTQIWASAEEAQRYQQDLVLDVGMEPNEETRGLNRLRAQAAANLGGSYPIQPN